MHKRWIMLRITDGTVWCRMTGQTKYADAIYAFLEQDPMDYGWQHLQELRSLAEEITHLCR